MSLSAEKISSDAASTRARVASAVGQTPNAGAPVAIEGRQIALVSDLAPAYLAWQCRMIAGVMRGAVFLRGRDGNLGPVAARWPERGKAPQVLDDLAARTFSSGRAEICAQIRYSDTLGQVCDALSVPVVYDGATVAVVVVTLSTRSEPQQKAVMQLIEWGTNWFATLLKREAMAQSRQTAVLFDLVSVVLAQPDYRLAAAEAVALLAARAGCERVSLGVARQGRLRLVAASGVETFDARTQFVTRLEDAMEEAAEQDCVLQYPAPDDQTSQILRAHKRLADTRTESTIMTVVSGDESCGRIALVAEFASLSPLTDTRKTMLTAAAQALLQPLALLRQADQPLSTLLRKRNGARASAGGRKFAFIALTIAALLAVAAIVPAAHRVTADASLNGIEQRAIVAPISGYVGSTSVRPGDDVRAGDTLAELDTRDLQLEQNKWQSLRGARQAEYQQALARRDRTEISVLRANLDQIDAEMSLVQGKLARATLRAPYAGVVVSGDLSQALDSPVEQGQVLFEIAPLTAYRVVLEVDEHDIAALQPGLSGHLRLTALPDRLLPMTIERVLPVAVSGDGHSYFRVEAALTEQPPQLRPGMRGVGKIEIGERSLLWLWSHALIDRARLVAWSLGI